MKNKKVLNKLKKWSDYVFTEENDFLERFGKGDPWDLVSVYWNEERMNVTYVCESGQYINDSFPIEEWLEYYSQKT